MDMMKIAHNMPQIQSLTPLYFSTKIVLSDLDFFMTGTAGGGVVGVTSCCEDEGGGYDGGGGGGAFADDERASNVNGYSISGKVSGFLHNCQ